MVEVGEMGSSIRAFTHRGRVSIRTMASNSEPSEPEKLQLADRPPALTREEVVERIKYVRNGVAG